MEPRTAALFLTAMARRGLKLSTIRRRAAAISRAHRQAGHTSPIWDPRVITVLEGIARTVGAAPQRKVALIRDPLLVTVDRIDSSTTAGYPCAVRALRAWLDASEITSGPVFRRVTRTGAVSSPLTAQSVALIIKRRVKAAGLDPAAFAGHSLRSGFATQAARDGYRPAEIADVTRHRDQRVLDGYIQAAKGAEHVARVL